MQKGFSSSVELKTFQKLSISLKLKKTLQKLLKLLKPLLSWNKTVQQLWTSQNLSKILQK